MKPLSAPTRKGGRLSLSNRDLGVVLTPVIDVIFLLQIFFLCTAQWDDAEHRLPTPLHQGKKSGGQGSTQRQDLESIHIELIGGPKQTVILLNREKIKDFDILKKRLAGLGKLAPELPVTIKTNAQTPFSQFVTLYDACRAARFQKITLALSPPNVDNTPTNSRKDSP